MGGNGIVYISICTIVFYCTYNFVNCIWYCFLSINSIWKEVKSICDTVQPDGVRLLYWDTQICRDEKYDADKLDGLVKSTKPEGGGGTDVTCVTDYIRDNSINAQAASVLTDGYLYGGWGQWSLPVLWAIVDHKHARPSVGKAVHIRSEVM